MRWTFGDNTTQTGSVVTKSWPNAGTYIVTLTATNGEGTDTTQIPITVFDKVVPPTALIEASGTSATVGQSLSFFSRSSGNATDLKWDFGDRVTGSGASIRHSWSYARHLHRDAHRFQLGGQQHQHVAGDDSRADTPAGRAPLGVGRARRRRRERALHEPVDQQPDVDDRGTSATAKPRRGHRWSSRGPTPAPTR